MTRSRTLGAGVARRAALEERLARLKIAAWAVVAGTWLALWALVTGAVAGTSQAPAPTAASGVESPAIDLFGQGSTLGTTSDRPVLQSHGS